MKTRLGWIIALIEIVSVSCLVLLLNEESLPAKIGITLVFLQPIAFGLHVFEEFIFPGGYTDWYKTYNPGFAEALTPSYLFKINAIPLVASMLVSLGAFDYRGGYSFFGIRAWLAFMCILAFNAFFHIRGAIQTKRYSPGVTAGVVLYLPLTMMSFIYFLRTGEVDLFSVVICVAIGSSFQSVLDYIKKRGLKKEGQVI